MKSSSSVGKYNQKNATFAREDEGEAEGFFAITIISADIEEGTAYFSRSPSLRKGNY